MANFTREAIKATFIKLLEERPDIKNQLLNVEDGKIYSLPRIEEMGLLQSPRRDRRICLQPQARHHAHLPLGQPRCV